MLGIITKDLYQNFCIRKNSLSFAFNYLVLFYLLLSKNNYVYFFTALVLVPMSMAPFLIQFSSERDNISHFEKTQLTLPVSKKEVITVKYGLGLFYSLINTGLVLLGVLYQSFFTKALNPRIDLYLILGCSILSLFSVAINYLATIILGTKAILIYLIFAGSGILMWFADPIFDFIAKLVHNFSSYAFPFFLITFLLASLTLVVSYWIACRYYEKKEIH